jgi:hypothetical protein
MSSNGVAVIPGAKRLIRSLRDMGYEFSTAVADLVDNSIEARANTVRITVEWAGEASYVMISDNGVGMSSNDLRESLRFGSERDYESDDLGKFGLGLKTASLSQCSRLTVASRRNESRADIDAYCWDLGHVDSTNRWEILPVKTADLQISARVHLKETTGTVVIWEQLDRILGYHRPDGEMARKQLMGMCRDLEEHLSMVFHRFLAGEVRGRRLAIYVNDNKIMPWDPFARGEGASKLDSISMRIDGSKGKSDVVLEPYVLPAQAKFSSPDAFNRASGPNKWNRQQGFYIYRADRMIQSGGWSNLRTLDEHLKLARVALYFSPKLDDEFKINVPKMRVALPGELRDSILKALAPTLKLANAAYRAGEKGSQRMAALSPSQTAAANGIRNEATNKNENAQSHASQSYSSSISPSAKSNGSANNSNTPNSGIDFAHFEALLAQVALPDELPVIKRVVARALQTYGG